MKATAIAPINNADIILLYYVWVWYRNPKNTNRPPFVRHHDFSLNFYYSSIEKSNNKIQTKRHRKIVFFVIYSRWNEIVPVGWILKRIRWMFSPAVPLVAREAQRHSLNRISFFIVWQQQQQKEYINKKRKNNLLT